MLFGHSVVEPYRIANKLGTIYDAGISYQTTHHRVSLLTSGELGELTLDSSVSHYVPEFDRTDKQMITVRELLTHWRGSTSLAPTLSAH